MICENVCKLNHVYNSVIHIYYIYILINSTIISIPRYTHVRYVLAVIWPALLIQ